MSAYLKSTQLLLGEKRIEVRVAGSHISPPTHEVSQQATHEVSQQATHDASEQVHDALHQLGDHGASQLEWCVLACLIEHGRRPFDVMATGVSKGIPDEEVAIRLALLNLSEKVNWQDQELVAQALIQPMDVVVSRQFSLRGIFSRKPREVSEVAALLRSNLPT